MLGAVDRQMRERQTDGESDGFSPSGASVQGRGHLMLQLENRSYLENVPEECKQLEHSSFTATRRIFFVLDLLKYKLICFF